MLAEVTSFGLNGIGAYRVEVQSDLSGGLPAFELVGLPGKAVRESRDRVRAALLNGGYTFPVVMDVTGEVFYSYGISAFPTTFMIGADGNVFGYVPGALTGDMMESIVQQTIDGVEAGA